MFKVNFNVNTNAVLALAFAEIKKLTLANA